MAWIMTSSIRGISMVAINNWVHQYLRDDYPRFLAQLRPVIARDLSRATEWEWYPAEHVAEIYQCISCNKTGPGKTREILDLLGRFLAETDWQASPHANQLPLPRLLARLSFFWARFLDCGELKLVSIDKEAGTAEITLTGCACGPMHRDVTRTWIEQLLSHISESKVKIIDNRYSHQMTDSFCWKVTWK
jgi:hypothetical protein